MALSAQARAQAARGEAARATFAQALERLAAIGDRAHQADAETGLGELELAAARPSAARPPLERALALARTLGQRRREAKALSGLGRLARAEGRPEEALRLFDDALAALESERVHLPGAEEQTRFSALAAAVAEEGIETALGLDRAHPGAGWSGRALARVERSRGRALVELLAQSGVDLEAAADPERAARRAELSRRLAAKAERSAGQANAALREQLAREAAEIGAELDLLDAEIRARAPAAAALLDPRPLDLSAFVAGLPADTLVLVFRLGDPTSTLWALARERVATFGLPSRPLLERAAPMANTPLLLLTHLRGSEPSPTANRLDLRGGEGIVQLALDAGEATGFGSYRATLTDAAGKKLFAADDLHPNALEVILLTFPREFFARGEYRLRLEGRRADGAFEEIEGYRFQVVRN